MATICVAGIQHETNTFSPITTTLADFEQADNWPARVAGEALFDAVAGKALPIAGFVERAQQLGHVCVPLQWCSAMTSGEVEAHAFATLLEELLAAIQSVSQDIDAVYLDLHGAMVSAAARDADGEVLQRVRALIGSVPWLMASLDCHANVSPVMFSMADVLVSYRTYPHVDAVATGARVANMFHHYHGAGVKPEKRFFAFDFQVPIVAGCSLVEPAASVFQALEVDHDHDSLCLSFNLGFPLADTADTRPTCLAYAQDQETAEQQLLRLVQSVKARQAHFLAELWSVDDAIEAVLSQPSFEQPVIFADTQDNPGCGGSGDTTGLLRAVLAQPQLAPALVATLYDPRAAERAFEAGVGAQLTLTVGEWQESSVLTPLTLQVEVVAVSDRPVPATGAFYAGCEIDLGRFVRVRVEHVDIIIASRNVQAADQAILRQVHAEPLAYRLLVLKSSVHFRADFQSLAQRILVVESPGLNTANLSSLPYRYLSTPVER